MDFSLVWGELKLNTKFSIKIPLPSNIYTLTNHNMVDKYLDHYWYEGETDVLYHGKITELQKSKNMKNKGLIKVRVA